ncbi:MAG: aminoglycoside phosphotransferase family protein [Anaerolineae bacterium]|nr:aminoglycoside phosphotransferase family protein [Anaerolineae bacterium]
MLDPDAFAEQLNAKMDGLEVDKVRARYVRYKPYTSCLVAFDVVAGGNARHLFATAFTRDGLMKYRKHQNRLRQAGLMDKNDLWRDEQIVICRFPADRALPQLPNLADGQRRTELLASLLPQAGAQWGSALETLHYKPEQRYVAKLSSATGEVAVIKAYADETFKQASAAVKHVRSSGALRVPARLGRSRRHRILLLEWLPGHSLANLGRNPDCDGSSIATVGAALAELHMQDVKLAETVDSEALIASLFANARTVAHLHPPCASRALQVSRDLDETIRKQPKQRSLIHGDFSADQVLVAGDTAAFIDLDSSGLGDPRIDLGSFLAVLNLEAALGRTDDATVDSINSNLRDGYHQVREIGRAPELWPYVAASLLLRVAEPFRYRMPDWPAATAAIIERAEVIARERRF